MIEDEIRKNICASTTSLNSDRSLAELSEMLTIQDYQSVMESRVGTDTIPTARDQYFESESVVKNNQHGKNNPSFSKTQNINDFLRNFNEQIGNNFPEETLSLNNSKV